MNSRSQEISSGFVDSSRTPQLEKKMDRRTFLTLATSGTIFTAGGVFAAIEGRQVHIGEDYEVAPAEQKKEMHTHDRRKWIHFFGGAGVSVVGAGVFIYERWVRNTNPQEENTM